MQLWCLYHYALNKHVQPRSQNPASGSTRKAGTTYSYVAHVSEQEVRNWDGQESCLEESKSRKVESLVENSLRQRAAAVMAPPHLVPVASVVAYFSILDRSQNKAIIEWQLFSKNVSIKIIICSLTCYYVYYYCSSSILFNIP